MTKTTEGQQIIQIILNELENSSANQIRLTDSLSSAKEEIIKLGGIRYSIADLKKAQEEINKWREEFAEIINDSIF